jgi:hypothetical protein
MFTRADRPNNEIYDSIKLSTSQGYPKFRVAVSLKAGGFYSDALNNSLEFVTAFNKKRQLNPLVGKFNPSIP